MHVHVCVSMCVCLCVRSDRALLCNIHFMVHMLKVFQSNALSHILTEEEEELSYNYFVMSFAGY